jgi:uncharacterized protein with HEPN domain
MRSDTDRLNDILGAIAKIEERATDCFETFQADELLQVWVIHHLQVIGEAARGLISTPQGQPPGGAVATCIRSGL